VVPDVPDPEALPPAVTQLHPCRPNPFNPATTVSFDLHLPGAAVLEVFDMRGHLVAVLHRGDLGIGSHEFIWRGSDDSGRAVPTGVYFARLVTATHRETRRMALIK
jgi:flagellar hook assembly protein FlgD